MAISTITVSDVETTIYTSVGNSAITLVSFCNFSNESSNLTLHVVPNGSMASDSNIMLKEVEITASDTYMLYVSSEKLLLENGDSLIAIASQSLDSTDSIAAIVSYTSI